MVKTKKSTLAIHIPVPTGVSVSVCDGVVDVSGPCGKISRCLMHPRVSIRATPQEIVIVPTDEGSLGSVAKMFVNTYCAHIRNMLKGVVTPFIYELKICSGHFPMTVSVKDGFFEVKNFLGEKVPRRVALASGADVKIVAEIITVSSVDREIAGCVAASIEQLCRISNRDRRVFMDGIWITKKAGKGVLS